MIKIEDLDEFEGLTADMVRAWLRNDGWREEPRGGWMPPGRKIKGGLRVCCMADVITPTDGILEMLTAIQHYTKRSPQSLLREINPRMRAGWPSEEEIQRHARWIARNQNTGTVVVGVVKPDEEHGAVLKLHSGFLAKAFADGWSFWPCDQHGNKTRRGA